MAKIGEVARTPAPAPVPRPAVKPADIAKKGFKQKAINIPKQVINKSQFVNKRTGKR